MKSSYLTEALYGNYTMEGEDRISQIFSASFNHSVIFQRAVMQFFNLSFQAELHSDTQITYTVNDRPAKLDILIKKSNSNLIVVENKIDAPLTKQQLSKYDKVSAIKKCKKYCFVKHYKTISEISKTWNICYWGDFYIRLVSLEEKDFVTNNFIAILKKYDMERPSVIKKTDLKNLSKAFHSIRYENRPHFNYNQPIFEAVVDFKKILEDIFRKAAKHDIILKRTGKTFRPSMHFSYWWEDVDIKKGKELLWIGCQAKMVKPHNKIDRFGAALLLYNKSEKYDIVAYVGNAGDSWDDDMYYFPKKDLNCLEFEHEAIKYWSRKLK